MFLSFIHKEDYCDESAQSASQASESYDLYGQNARARFEVLSRPEKTKRIVTSQYSPLFSDTSIAPLLRFIVYLNIELRRRIKTHFEVCPK